MSVPIAVRTTPTPTWHAVTLLEAKHQVGLPSDVGDFDGELKRLIRTAQQTLESDQSRIVSFGTFVWEFDQFPLGPLRLPVRDSVSEPIVVEYTDTSGNLQTATDYVIALNRVWPELVPTNGVWPEAQVGVANSVKVTFDAGWANAGEVPDELKQTILSMVSSMFTGCGDDDFGPATQSLNRRQVATYL